MEAAVLELPAEVAPTRRPTRGRPKTRTTPAAQVNVRMDPSLKTAGDAGLARAGLSPSEAVRAVWKIAAEGGERLDRLVELCLAKRTAADASELYNFDSLFLGVERGIQAFLDEHAPGRSAQDMKELSEDEIEDALYADFLMEGTL